MRTFSLSGYVHLLLSSDAPSLEARICSLAIFYVVKEILTIKLTRQHDHKLTSYMAAEGSH